MQKIQKLDIFFNLYGFECDWYRRDMYVLFSLHFSIEILIKLHKSLFFCICNMIVTSDVHMTHSNHTLNRWQRSLHATHLHHVWVETLHFRTAFSPLYIYIYECFAILSQMSIPLCYLFQMKTRFSHMFASTVCIMHT